MAARPVNMRLRESGMMPFTTYIRGMAEKRFPWPGMGGSAGLSGLPAQLLVDRGAARPYRIPEIRQGSDAYPPTGPVRPEATARQRCAPSGAKVFG
jgi:hypothetical protein